MSRLQFSLAGLLGGVALIALATAAFRSSSGIEAGALFTIVLCFLLAALLGAIYSCGESRAFWVGTAVFGWSYMLFAYGPWFSNNTQYHLLGTRMADYLSPKLRRQVPTAVPARTTVTVGAPGGGSGGFGGGMVMGSGPAAPAVTIVGPDLLDVARACHSVVAALVAVVGGFTARYFYRSHREPADEPGGK